MKFTYDPRYNIAYIRFHEKEKNIESIHVSDELIVDMAPDGTIYGLELLNANKQLFHEDKGKLIIVNEATGKHLEWPMEAI
ncbi:hypothetical protein ES705_31954 [subsurface metagenome]